MKMNYIDMTEEEFMECWRAHKKTLREKSRVRVKFIVEFHPDGEVKSVIPECELPCQCEECVFRRICFRIISRIRNR